MFLHQLLVFAERMSDIKPKSVGVQINRSASFKGVKPVKRFSHMRKTRIILKWKINIFRILENVVISNHVNSVPSTDNSVMTKSTTLIAFLFQCWAWTISVCPSIAPGASIPSAARLVPIITKLFDRGASCKVTSNPAFQRNEPSYLNDGFIPRCSRSFHSICLVSCCRLHDEIGLVLIRPRSSRQFTVRHALKQLRTYKKISIVRAVTANQCFFHKPSIKCGYGFSFLLVHRQESFMFCRGVGH